MYAQCSVLILIKFSFCLVYNHWFNNKLFKLVKQKFIIFRITLLIFIKITSSSALSGLNTTISTEISEGVKDHKNSSNKCWLREENTILKECHLCSDRLECINASYVETIKCKISGLAYRKYVYTINNQF